MLAKLTAADKAGNARGGRCDFPQVAATSYTTLPTTPLVNYYSRSLQSAAMDDGRPATLIAWIECNSCGRFGKATHDFHYPADMASDMEFFVLTPCERCGRQAKLHFRRELKRAH